MMLFKLSWHNIKKSFKDYAIYFFTLILGVAIFYVFNAIDSQTIMLNVSSSTRQLIKLMTSMLSGVSVFVSVVLGFLIIYASRFLMKRRNKEFGIYMTLGMSKGSISKILLVETLLIGVLSLIVGLGVGIFLSQMMSIFVANMFEADLTRFTFTFSEPALLKTLGYFSIMYLFVMIFNTISVSKCKLIDLIYANKKAEKIHLKNSYLCTIIFIMAVGTLSYAYRLVMGEVGTPETLLLAIALGCISTFFIFWSLSGLLLRITQSLKRFYYKNIHSFTLRQISSKINTTVMSMSVICIMLFLTICILSSAISLKNSLNENIENLAPIDIQIFKRRNLNKEAIKDGFTKEEISSSYKSILETLEYLEFDYQKNLQDPISTLIYTSPEVTIRTTLGSTIKQVEQEYPRLSLDTVEQIVAVSDYNRLATLLNLDKINLNPDQYVLVADYDAWVNIRNLSLEAGTTITVNNHYLKPKYKKCQNGFLDISSNHINTGFFVVPDEVVEGLDMERELLSANYKADNEEEKKQIEDQLYQIDKDKLAKSPIDAATKISIKEASVGLGAMVTFIGIYLGIIFLLSSAAILALKELSESADSKERYNMLRKIGVDEQMIHKSLFSQMMIFFAAPLLLAVIHSIFGIKFCNTILESAGTTGMLSSIIMTAMVILLIYGGYFCITYLTSKNIIKSKN